MISLIAEGNDMNNGFDFLIYKAADGRKMNLQYRKARPDEAEKVCYVVQHTKAVIYPDYYTQAVVEFFGRLHSLDNIKSDIAQGRIGVLVKDGEVIGTGSRTENHITIV